MPIQSEIIYPESITAHLTSFEFCPVFDKNGAKVRLCVCSGVLIMVTYGHDRFFVTVTSRMDIIYDMTKWAVHLWFFHKLEMQCLASISYQYYQSTEYVWSKVGTKLFAIIFTSAPTRLPFPKHCLCLLPIFLAFHTL